MELAFLLAKIAGANVPANTEHAGGCLGDDADRTAFGVAAKQSALRSLQNLDPVDVEECRIEALLAAEIDAIDVCADALVAGGLVGVEWGDPTNADDQRGLTRLEGRDAKARDRAVTEIEQAGRVAVGERLRIRDVDRDRRLLEVRLAFGRGDDDRT